MNDFNVTIIGDEAINVTLVTNDDSINVSLSQEPLVISSIVLDQGPPGPQGPQGQKGADGISDNAIIDGGNF